MLNKIYLIIVVFLACGWGYQYFMYNSSKTKLSYAETKINALYVSNRELKGNNDVLQAEIEKRNKNALETGERLRELARLAEEEKNKGGFDWTMPLPDDTVVDKLRAN